MTVLKNLFAATGVSALLLGTLLSCGGGGGGDNNDPPPSSEPNEKPVANAGFDQTVSNGDRVILDGSRSSDPNGSIITFDWALQQKPDGSQAELNNPTSPNPDFLIDQPGTYAVKLTVSDSNQQNSDPDQVHISTTNSPPVADAGSDQTTQLNQTITLDGTGSGDVDGDALGYLWELTRKPANSQAMLSDETAPRPTLDIDQTGEYVVTLRVNDGQVDSEADLVTIKPDNTPPTANAGPDHSAQTGNNVVLDGTRSTDVDGDALTYKWSLSTVPENSQANIDTPNNLKPIFNIDQTGTYVAQLIVNDGQINSNPDTIRINTENSRPTARAGDDQAITVGEQVVLNGSNSGDPDSDTLMYNWSIQSRPNNSTATLTNPTTDQPGFTADIAGTYVIQLIVNDGVLHSEPDTTVASTINTRPIAIPEAMQTVSVNDLVALNAGNSTDADSDILSYKWALLIKPETSTAEITGTTIVNPGIELDQPGIYVIQLIVNDGELYSKPATITVEAKDVTLTANAGPDQHVSLDDVVILDGSNSTGTTNGTLTYQWTILQKPNGSNVTLTDRTIVNPQFTVTDNGNYLVELIVSENSVASAPDTVLITTASAPAITSFSPANGPVSTLITILGENFKPTANTLPIVTLNAKTGGTINAPVTSFDNTSINFTVPAGSATGPITVEVSGQAVTSTESFTLVASKNFTLTTANTSAKVIRGYSAVFSLSLSTTTRFNQLANLTVTGLPAGMQASFKPEAITSGQQTVLSITAAQDQPIDTSTITVTAQADVEGINVSDSVDLQFTVEAVTTSFMGRTVIDNNSQTALGGITVTFIGKDAQGNDTGCTASTVSDAAGNFVFTNLPVECQGIQLIRYDGLTASNTGNYAGVDLQYTIVANQVTQSPVLVHLPRIDNAETVQVIQNHTEDQEFVFNTIPYLEVTVYAGTTLTLPDGTQPDPFPLIAIDIAIDRLPEEMPPSSTEFIPFIVAFQPANSKASQPVAVTFPNTTDVAPGTRVTLSTLDPTKGVMVPYGTGLVSPSGAKIIPDFDPAFPGRRFGLVHFDWHGPITAPPNGIDPATPPLDPAGGPIPETGAPPKNACSGSNTTGGIATAGDPVDLASGLFVLNNRDIGFNCSRGSIYINRVYRNESTAVGPFGTGSSHNYDFRLDTSTPQNAAMVNLIMPDGNRIPLTDPNPLVERPSGRSTRLYVNLAQPAMRGAELIPYSNGEADIIWRNGQIFHFIPVRGSRTGSVLSSITDRNGNTISINRNPSNLVIISEVVDAVGRKLSFEYDTRNRITRIFDPAGREVLYSYNTQGSLETYTDPEGNITAYAYDANNRMTTITDARNIVTVENVYNINGKVLRQKQADDMEFIFDYQLLNPDIGNSPIQQTFVTDPRGKQTVYRFNTQGFVTAVTDPLGQTREFTRQPGTNLLLAVSGNGICDVCGSPQLGDISYTYDERGNRTSTTDASGNTTRVTYTDRFNNIETVTDPLNNVTRFEYDTKGNLIKTIDAKLRETTVAYNLYGLPVKITDPANNNVVVEYDEQANPVTVSDSLGNRVRTRYDAISRPVEVIDALGRRSITTYDRLGRATETTDAKGNKTFFSYNKISQLLTLTDARNNTTSYEYNNMGYLAKRTDSLGNFDLREYDANGNLIRFTDRRGQISTYAHDDINRSIRASYQDSSSVEYRYDARSRLMEVNDSVGGIYSFDFDAMGRVTSTSSPTGSVRYAYDVRSLLKERQVIGQSTLTYGYDELAGLISASMPEASIDFTYDIRNLPKTITRSNGVSTGYEYDTLGRLTKILHQNTQGIINEQSYGLDATGNRILNTTEIAQSLTTRASTSIIDAESNRLLNHGDVSYTYDNNGNREMEADSTGITSYIWDARNRLQSITKPTGEVIGFRYDFGGNMIEQTRTNGGVVYSENYVLDLITNVAMQANSNGEQISVLTVDGIDTHLAAVHNDGQIDFGLRDGINSTVTTTDSSGAIKDTFYYEPFGETQATSANYPFQYTGRTPTAGNLYYYRARFYDSIVGRFISEDPIGINGGSNNYFLYVKNNSINYVDPAGLKDKKNPTQKELFNSLIKLVERKHGSASVREVNSVLNQCKSVQVCNKQFGADLPNIMITLLGSKNANAPISSAALVTKTINKKNASTALFGIIGSNHDPFINLIKCYDNGLLDGP